MNELLKRLGACSSAKKWAFDKTWKEVYETCHRGDWLIWLFDETNPNHLKELSLTAGHCVNTVRHLMTDKRSTDAVDAAIAFGLGKITRDKLIHSIKDNYVCSPSYADAAYDVYANFSSSMTFTLEAYAAYAAHAVSRCYMFFTAVEYAASAAASAASAAGADASDAKIKNQKETADICRKYLPIEIWNIKTKN